MSAAAFSGRAESMYFAQPYYVSAVGFYFTDLADYEAKAAVIVDDFRQAVEEFKLQYIDGEFARLFEALRISQANLANWFELVDQFGNDGDRYLITCHLAELGYDISELPSRWDDYSLLHGSATDYAAEIVAECYEIPGNLASYIDYERLGRDMVLNGDIAELDNGLILLGG